MLEFISQVRKSGEMNEKSTPLADAIERFHQGGEGTRDIHRAGMMLGRASIQLYRHILAPPCLFCVRAG